MTIWDNGTNWRGFPFGERSTKQSPVNCQAVKVSLLPSIRLTLIRGEWLPSERFDRMSLSDEGVISVTIVAGGSEPSLTTASPSCAPFRLD